MDLVPSDEQQCVVDACANFNVCVNSVPGSGKTTTILSIIDQYINKKKSILVLTYNSRLRKETIAKVEDLFELCPVLPEIHTYHSFSQRTWKIPCNTDSGIKKIIERNLPKQEDCDYDIVIIDEAQDMTENYYLIYEKVIKPNTQIVMLGDERQAIYQFNGADSRFLLLANRINRISNREFINVNLSISYRLSKPLADFVNNCVVGRELIKPSPLKLEDYPMPTYIIDDFFHKPQGGKITEASGVIEVVRMIKDYLEMGYSPEDIFILTPSVKAPQLKSNGDLDFSKFPSASQCLAWSLMQHHHGLIYDGKPLKIFVPNFDDAALDNDVVADKIVFCTFHKSKGLERKIVFVLGFDESYEKFYNKHGKPGICPNPMYVAITRSAEHLVLLHHFTKNPLSFIDLDKVQQYTLFEERKNMKKEKPIPDSIIRKVFPSDITRHMRNEFILGAKKMIQYSHVRKIQTVVNLRDKQQDEDNCEQVSEINSFYISLLHNIFVSKNSDVLLGNRESFIQGAEEYIVEAMKKYGRDDMANDKCPLFSKTLIPKLLKYSTYCCGVNNGYLHKYKQIKSFSWIKPDNAMTLLTRLDKVLSNNCTYEDFLRISYEQFPELANDHVQAILSGRTDIIDHDKKIVWEIKCVQQLRDEHYIQLAIYKYMHMKKAMYPGFKYYLFNIRTGEVVKVMADDGQLIGLMTYLLDKKFSPQDEDNDEEFIKKFK